MVASRHDSGADAPASAQPSSGTESDDRGYRMNRSTRMLVALAAVAAAVGIAPAANATDFHGTTCPGSPYACLWKDTGFATAGNVNAYMKFSQYFPYAYQFVFAGTGYSVDDKTSSMVNDATSRTVWMYNGYKCGGSETVSKGPQTFDSDFSNDSPLAGGAFNDSLSSAAFADYLTSCKNS